MDTITHLIKTAVQSRNVHTLAAQYQQQQQMLVIEDFIPAAFVLKYLLPEVELCNTYVHRVNIPHFKKSGSVSYQLLKQYAPMLFDIYQNPLMKTFIEDVVGEKLSLSPDHDPHASALYYYTEPGDRIGMHYDKSFYKGKRFTVLLGLIQQSEKSKLICYPGARKKSSKKNPIAIATHPGTLVLFNGDALWHEVSALGEQERRVILTMEYLTTCEMSPIYRFISNFKDRLLYFGKPIQKDSI